MTQLAPANVLVVDDNPANLISLKGILKAPDINVVTAASGNEALGLLLEGSYACILLDVQMPGMTGLDVARLLKEDPQLHSVPTIFMTAHHQDETDIFKGYEFGAVDYLMKPVEPAIVRAKVRVFADLFRKQQLILQLNTAMQESHDEVSQFTKVVAHDLKEPVRLVETYSRLLESAVSLPQEATTYLGFMVENARRITHLLDGLVGFLNVRDAKDIREGVDVNTVVAEITSELRERMEAQGARIVTDDLPMISGDRGQIRLLFRNLFDNALRFHGKENVTIQVSATRLKDEYIFSIVDNSAGIERRHHDRIFELFQKLEGGPESGTGVGLALTRLIVEKHGGRIWLDSTPGKGSTFYFSIPAREYQQGALAGAIRA